MIIAAQQPDSGHTAFEQALKRHLSQSQMPKFDDYLLDEIIGQIRYQEQLKILKPKLWTALGVCLSSLGLIAWAFAFSWTAFAQTPISHYLQLLFSDFGQVLTNWQDYSLGLLENLPLGASVFLLSSFLASLLLIDYGSRQLSNFRKLSNSHSHWSH